MSYSHTEIALLSYPFSCRICGFPTSPTGHADASADTVDVQQMPALAREIFTKVHLARTEREAATAATAIAESVMQTIDAIIRPN